MTRVMVLQHNYLFAKWVFVSAVLLVFVILCVWHSIQPEKLYYSENM